MSERCYDCLRPYGAPGFPDLMIPHDDWQVIAPQANKDGLLCPSCMCARLEKAGVTTTGVFTSGPLNVHNGELSETERDMLRIVWTATQEEQRVADEVWCRSLQVIILLANLHLVHFKDGALRTTAMGASVLGLDPSLTA